MRNLELRAYINIIVRLTELVCSNIVRQHGLSGTLNADSPLKDAIIELYAEVCCVVARLGVC